jgi:hypothetical protein
MSTPDLHDDDELPPELRSALQNLPRERHPGRLLEERTVRALREHGVIEAAAPRRGIRRLPASWLGGAVAASLALFASGMTVGQWMGTRATAGVVSAVQAENSRNTAMLVQQTGTAYVQALRQLTAQDSGAQAGREVAVRLLRTAADELVRIAPDDPVASAVMAGFQKADTTKTAAGDKQRVVWF